MRYRTLIIPLAALALLGCRNAANDDPANEVIHADRTGGLTPRVHHQARTRPPGHALPSRRMKSPPPANPTTDPVPSTADNPAIIDRDTDARVREQLPPQ